MCMVQRIPSGDLRMLHHPASPSRRACETAGQQVDRSLVGNEETGRKSDALLTCAIRFSNRDIDGSRRGD